MIAVILFSVFLSLAGEPQVPLEPVIARALERRPGKFLEAELEETARGRIYEIEILGLDNVVYKLKFSAATGEFLGEEED